ncbi:DUF6403 family protein [Micromonospora craniellae]|uniref:Uncharacterized protein n=1 Tax=Micromonospora craniellae TaxID=2294034 RepID=A0A372FZR0_9ACTN|nr:DUF6403 family protein [Micromonospora craniellae]QOC91403.1 hypothetical protein ID554_26065 [Micromonospora craniellae]RFS46272.1 hypothetical protein D0Q02_12545 [Micromonospora craniellae]
MSPSLLTWLSGSVLLLGAGVLTTLLPRLHSRRRDRLVAWSTARAAIDSATVSRDAATTPVPEADGLLARAERLAADDGGVTAAREAAGYARRADELWQARR